MRGKALFKITDCTNFQDHPRLCGEKSSNSVINSISLGSPPPMRGKEDAEREEVQAVGDHPRLCGEK